MFLRHTRVGPEGWSRKSAQREGKVSGRKRSLRTDCYCPCAKWIATLKAERGKKPPKNLFAYFDILWLRVTLVGTPDWCSEAVQALLDQQSQAARQDGSMELQKIVLSCCLRRLPHESSVDQAEEQLRQELLQEKAVQNQLEAWNKSEDFGEHHNSQSTSCTLSMITLLHIASKCAGTSWTLGLGRSHI